MPLVLIDVELFEAPQLTVEFDIFYTMIIEHMDRHRVDNW